MKTEKYPVSRNENIIVQELKNELLVYDLLHNKAYCLNETSALIWQSCDGRNSISAIALKLSKTLKSPVTEDLVWFALNQLKQDDLLADSCELGIRFEGLSRREVIRKVGVASMIALPVIASLVAPTAAMAQSAGACGAAAQTCCSGSTCNAGLNCELSRCCIPNFSSTACTSDSQCCSGGICCDNHCVLGDCGEV